MIVIAMKKSLILSFLISLMVLGSCSQIELEQNNKIDEGEVLEIKDQELSFSIFEIVSIDLGETTFSEGQIVGTTLEGEKIDLFIQDNVLSFMVPKINQGSYKLVFSENNKPFNIAFEVKAQELKLTPAAYLESYQLKSQELVAALEKSKSFLQEDQQASFAADIATMKQAVEKQFAEASTLSSAEKSDMAYFIQANQEWMDELTDAIAALQEGQPNGRMLFDLVENIEVRSEKISQAFLYSKLIMEQNLQKMPVGASSNYVHKGIKLTGGIGQVYTYMNFINLLGSIESQIGLIYIGEGGDFNTTIGANHYFKNETPFELEVFRKYRTLYKDDANSQIPFVREFVAGYRKVMANWKNFKPQIPLGLQFTPADITQNTNFTTQSLRIHSDHLTFSGITNPRVTGSSMKESGKFYLTFKTADEEANFRFKLTYEKQYYGKLEKDLEAKVVIKGPDEVLGGDTFTDPRDGNVYKIVKIGSQTWFAENLRYAGNIPEMTSEATWTAIWNSGNPTGQPAWTGYFNISDDAAFGKRYNWYAVSTGPLCPAGWHIPTDMEWTTLTNFLGGPDVAGGKMKSINGWDPPNVNATNESGFTGLPGGFRWIYGGSINSIGNLGQWWSSSESTNTRAIFLQISRSSGGVVRSADYMASGRSCRCLKD
jgi:uncharacterized protein (TIGR02145 family)